MWDKAPDSTCSVVLGGLADAERQTGVVNAVLS